MGRKEETDGKSKTSVTVSGVRVREKLGLGKQSMSPFLELWEETGDH